MHIQFTGSPPALSLPRNRWHLGREIGPNYLPWRVQRRPWEVRREKIARSGWASERPGTASFKSRRLRTQVKHIKGPTLPVAFCPVGSQNAKGNQQFQVNDVCGGGKKKGKSNWEKRTWSAESTFPSALEKISSRGPSPWHSSTSLPQFFGGLGLLEFC